MSPDAVIEQVRRSVEPGSTLYVSKRMQQMLGDGVNKIVAELSPAYTIILR